VFCARTDSTNTLFRTVVGSMVKFQMYAFVWTPPRIHILNFHLDIGIVEEMIITKVTFEGGMTIATRMFRSIYLICAMCNVYISM
jgi:hypothetical protein